MIVLDCNAAVAMLEQTKMGRALRQLMLEGETAISPALFHSELANILWKQSRAGLLDAKEAARAFEAGIGLVDEFIPDETLIVEAMQEALHFGHPVYDMLYLVLARRNAATLFTLDRKLMRTCEKAHVNCVELVAL